MADNDTSLFGDAPLFGESEDGFALADRRRANLNIPQALEIAPVEHAEALAGEKESGIPAAIIRDSKKEYERTRQERGIVDALDANPALREKFGEPDFAMLASDDMETLGRLERALTPRDKKPEFGVPYADSPAALAIPRTEAQKEREYWQRRLSAIERKEPSVGSYLAGLADSVPRFVSTAVAGLTELALDLTEEVGFPILTLAGPKMAKATPGPIAKTLRGMAEVIHDNEKVRRVRMTPKFKTATARYVYSGVESAIQYLINVGLAGGGFAASLGFMGTEVGLEKFPEYRRRGASVGLALVGGLFEGSVEAAGEAVPLGFVLKRFGKIGMKQFLAGLAVRDITMEEGTMFLQDAADTAIANPDKTWGEYWSERPEAMYATLVATLTQVGLFSGAHGLANRYTNSIDALETAKIIGDATTLVEDIALAELSPEEFKSFIDKAAEKGELKALHITPEDLESALEQSGVDVNTLPADIQEQFVSAGATGATIEIPLGTYLAQMSKTPLGKAVAQYLRKTPDAPTAAEAQSFLENGAGELTQAAKEIIAKQENMKEAEQEAAAVRDFYLKQLNTVGRFTKEVNGLYASLMRDFYVTMSARAGMKPTELLSQYQVHVVRQATTGAELMQLAKAKLVPSIKDNATGKVFTGKPGQNHADVAKAANFMDESGAWVTPVEGLTMGFSEGKTFYDRKAALAKFAVEDATDIDAPPLKPEDIVVEEVEEIEIKAPPRPLLQADKKAPRGGIFLPEGEIAPGEPSLLVLAENANLSTFLHESGHFFLSVMADLAGREGIPADVSADMNATLKWMGIKDLATWNKMSLEEKRPFHEKLARGFELYVFEGKAPSAEMQAMFTRFRGWMLRVYRSMQELNVELSDEVRGVFNRMLASEDKIRQAEEVKSFEPLFASIKESGLTESEFAQYVQLPLDSTDEAIRDLEKRSLRNMKWMRNARSRVIKDMQKSTREVRKAAREEAADDVLNSPLYKAYAFLRSGIGLEIEKGVSHKFAVNALERDIESKIWDTPEFRNRFTVKTDKGMHPDEVAEAFGLSSGEELVRFMATIDPPKVAIEAATDIIMLERYGDLVDPDQVEQAADAAIHNEFRAKAIRMELKALSKLANAPQYNTTRRNAKAVAAQVVAAMRLSDLKPSKYTVAAARLGREAKKALGEGEVELAAIRKREQLVSVYVAKEIGNFKTKTDKRRKALLRYGLKKVRKNLDANDMVQIDAILNRYELRPMSQKALAEKQALTEWLDNLDNPDVLGVRPEVAKELQNELTRQHYSTLSVEEFIGLADAVDSMAHVARSKRKAFILGKRVDLDELASLAAASIIANAKKVVPKRRAGLEHGPIKQLSAWQRGFRKEHRSFSSLLRQMDGNKDDGVLWNTLVRSMNTRSDYQTEEQAKATLALSKLLAPILKSGRLGKKTFIPALEDSYTREERIGIVLYAGAVVTRERILTGENWTEGQLQAVVDTLTKEELDFVQAVWDYMGTFRPAIAEKELRLKGIEPEWREAKVLRTRHGDYAGGYMPIRYDPQRDTKVQAQAENDVQRQMRRGLFAHSYTRRGHLESTAETTGRPLRYDFVNTMTEHVEQVIHDLAWHEWLVDTSRILRVPAFKDAVLKHYGMETMKELNNQIDAIAVGYIPAQTFAGRMLSHARKGATIVGLGHRVTTALVQPLGLIQSMVRIGPKWVGQGMGEWLTDTASFENTFTRIKEESNFMRHRPMNIMREVSEIRSKVRAKSQIKLFVEDTMFVFIVKMQLVADIPTYLGAKAKALAQPSMDEAKAIALAEQAVRDAQGSGQLADLATILRKDEATKLWTNFMSFFIRTYNIAAEQTAATNFAKPSQVAGLMLDYLLLFTIPATISHAMYEALKGGDKEPEELAKGLIKANITYMMGTMVFLRDIAGAVEGYDYRGPTGTRLLVDSNRLIQQIIQGETDMALAKAFLATGGTLLHIPTGQLITTLDGIMAISEGETTSPGALIAGGPTR